MAPTTAPRTACTRPSHAFLEKTSRNPQPLRLRTPHPGHVRAWAANYADEVRTDRHGNVLRSAHPGRDRPSGSGEPPRVMLAGHCDQIGSWSSTSTRTASFTSNPSAAGTCKSFSASTLRMDRHRAGAGVIGRRATHLMTGEERNKVPQFTDVWVDIGAKDRKDARNWCRPAIPSRSSWAIGRCATAWRRRRHGRQSGLWTVMEALRLLRDRPLQCAVYCVSTSRRRSACAGPPPAPTPSTRRSGRRGRVPRHGHAGQRQEAAGRHARRRRPGVVSRPEHQSARAGTLAGIGQEGRGPRAGARYAAGDGHRRQHHAAEPRGRGGRPHRHPQRYMHSPSKS